MRERMLGPYRGYFIAVTSLLIGEYGDRYHGWGKVFDRLPSSTADTGELLSVQCDVLHRSSAAALDDAEDKVFAAVDSLPERAAPPDPAEGPLEGLVYVSRARSIISVDQIQTLLRRARERNRENGVTGMLLYVDGTFIQYLEGPAPRVQLIYRIIRRDPLHQGLIKFVEQEIQGRVFPDWQMAYEMPGSDLWLPKESRPALNPGFDSGVVHALLAAFLQRQGVQDRWMNAASDRAKGGAIA